MKKLKTTMAFLIIELLILLFTSNAICPEIPPLPMTVRGYVFINTVEGVNITAPAGLEIFVKVGTEVIQAVEGSQNITDEYGYYCIGISGPEEGTPVDLWVENVNVTRITLQYYTVVELNLTVVDEEAPVINNLYPEPQSLIQANQPTWINATITDNLAINVSTIKMTLNGTELTPTYETETGLFYYMTEPLAEGLYIVNITAKDLAGNVATETWNFTASAEITPPTIEIISPTTENPIYTQSGRTIQITVKYTEQNPLNLTIRINTILEETFTDIPSGTDVTQTFNLTIPATAPEGKYSLNVTLYNIYNLSSTDAQENAVTIDNTLPVLTITYPAEGAYISAETIWINGTVTELNINGLQPSINDTRFTLAYWDPTTGTFAFKNETEIEDGPIALEVSFTDPAGCTGSATISFIQDTTAPVISTPYQDPPGQIVEPGQNITVRVNVTDIAVKEVILSYNITTTEWQNITMQLVGNEYVATIPSSELPAGTTIYYYIIAIDNANNVAKTPSNGTFFQFHVIPEFPVAVMLLMLMLITTLMAAALRKAAFKNKS